MYKLYYYQNGNLKRVPKYMRFQYVSIDACNEDVSLYWRLKEKYNNSSINELLPLIKQFVLIEEDRIIKIYNKNEL